MVPEKMKVSWSMMPICRRREDSSTSRTSWPSTLTAQMCIRDRIKVMRRGKVRRAKLYYLRELTGKAAKVKDKNNY